jgi:heptosyltransferase-1
MRILLIKTSSMGDVIHNLPVVSDIVARFPDAQIDWVVEENFTDIPRLHPRVHRVIPVALRRWRKALYAGATWSEIHQFRLALRQENYDYVIDTQGLLKSALITFAAVGIRCGYDAKSAREGLAALAYDRHFAVPTALHAVERNRALVAQVLGTVEKVPLNYGIALASIPDETHPAAVLLTASSRDDKLWPEALWVALGCHLSGRGIICQLPGGSVIERERATRLAAQIPNAIALPAQGLMALAQVLSGAQIVIGVDTGLVHLAAALSRPTVAIYCASDPTLTGVLATSPFVNLGSSAKAPSLSETIAATERLLDMPR